MGRAWANAVVVAVAALASACAPLVTPTPAEKRLPAEFPETFYQSAIARGEPVYRIDPERSLATILTYRGGSLARLGHDHVIASHDVRGYVLLAGMSATTMANLYIALDSLIVDEPEQRALAGFTTQPSETDIAGTRQNMLEKVLDAARYPFALIHVTAVEGEPAAPMLNATVSLHGITRALRIPVEVENRDGELRVSGHFSLKQTDFGITPYSILGGAMQVQDRLDLHFRIHARRI